MRVRIEITLDVNVAAYNREYGDTMSAGEIASILTNDTEEIVRTGLKYIDHAIRVLPATQILPRMDDSEPSDDR